MQKKIDYKEIIDRMGFFRSRANLSARETSLRLGYTEQFIKRIENQSVELKVSTLLDFLEVVDISVLDFFCLGKDFNKDDKYFLDLFFGLSDENRRMVIELMKKLK